MIYQKRAFGRKIKAHSKNTTTKLASLKKAAAERNELRAAFFCARAAGPP